MKLAIVVMLLCVAAANAQTRIVSGVEFGSGSANLSLGPTIAIEVPVSRHFEVDLLDVFSPAESHSALGTGWANRAGVRAIVFPRQSIGLYGKVEHSSYSVTKVSKSSEYLFTGIVVRKEVLDAPSRIYLHHIQQINNGVSPSGIETSHWQGAGVTWEIRIACTGPVCYRISEGFDIGHILEQGNPLCDGSIGPNTCGNRKGAISGDVTFGFSVEFPRHASF